ncbi:THAP domain-containing protein 10-like isoform X1 [Dermacentor albipictus]|uniref:THAP domain-containing protein 10-like isoform X1 n=1 Tax=Dermacentor albipictus TaxID=60249 RepID=UPI0031FE123E
MSRKVCVVALCPSGESDVPYHRFPRESSPRRQRWIDFVRASGRGDAWSPRESSRVCSRHFAPSCYKRHPASLARLGLSTKGLYLEPGALPTVYPAVRTPCPPGGGAVAAPFANGRPRRECCSDVRGAPAVSTGHCRLDMVSKATTTARLKVDATTQCAVLMTPKATMASRGKLASSVGVQTDRMTEDVGKLKIDATTQCAVLMTPKATMAVRTKRTSTVGLQTGRIVEQMGLRKADVATQCAVPMTLKATQATVNPRSTRTVGIQTTSATNQQLVDFGAVSWRRDLTTSSWR